MSLQPLDLPRRSFVWRQLAAAGARFAEVNGTACAVVFGDPQAEQVRVTRMGLADLSPLPRTGFKGRGTLEWLRSQGVTVPEDNNCVAVQADGTLACRLAPGEVLFLSAPDNAPEPVVVHADRDLSTYVDGERVDGGEVVDRVRDALDRHHTDFAAEPGLCAALDAAWPGPDAGIGTYKVPRPDTNLWFALTGSQAATMFSKICGVDLRPAHFADHAIAQTQVARLSGIVVRADIGAHPVYHLLSDSASAGYLLDVLLDAMAEFDGGLVGLSALRLLAPAPELARG